MTSLAVIIPTLDAEAHLRRLLPALKAQCPAPDRIVVVDSSSQDGTADFAREQGCEVRVIPARDFDHGATRNFAAGLAGEPDILVFMTQDALPVDADFLGRLVAPLVAGWAAASYARQFPQPHARPSEAFARAWNYPAHSSLRTSADQPRLGLRAFFFSNVAAAVVRADFAAVGGFPERVIINEDMSLCARLLQAGRIVAYQADAMVWHSHDYTLAQLVRRYFDIGVFQTEAEPALRRAGSAGAGLAFTLGLVAHLVGRGRWLSLPRAAAETALKFAAFHLGRRHRWLPRRWRRRLSLRPSYWDQDAG
jgi:rhamnosyltransferase